MLSIHLLDKKIKNIHIEQRTLNRIQRPEYPLEHPSNVLKSTKSVMQQPRNAIETCQNTQERTDFGMKTGLQMCSSVVSMTASTGLLPA